MKSPKMFYYVLYTPISKISEYSCMYITYNYMYYATVLHNYETHKNRNFKKKRVREINIFNACLLTYNILLRALAICQVPWGQKRNTQPQPCPPWERHSPASQQVGQLALLGAHPPVVTLTLSMMHPQLPHNLPWESEPRSSRVYVA